jgi:hypothetical protein
MDYRILNSWTIRDVYPLPLISTILDHLQGKSIFTKFDIRWGYENIRIREEDQWKAAFKTPFGLYQPKVMFFGFFFFFLNQFNIPEYKPETRTGLYLRANTI